MMMLAIEYLFHQIETSSSNQEYKIQISFLEVYNEVLKDLINNKEETNLELREDPVKGVQVTGSLSLITNADDVMNLLIEGNKHRTTESTAANLVSSRSHAVFTV